MMRRSNFDDAFDFRAMFERMNRQFEEMNRQFGQFAEMRPALESGASEGYALPAARSREWMEIDVAEYDGEVVVTADLPGFEKDDIDLSIAGETLTIRADRDVGTEHESDSYVHRERRHQSVRRTIRLPAEVREDDASASYTNGVLSVTLPKVEVDEDDDSHRIDID
jgi:HSP20 family protein